MAKRKLFHFFLALLGAGWFALTGPVYAEKSRTSPKWQHFELALKSTAKYNDPLQEVEVRALFVSPLGETNRVYGFWDGGKVWRIRYQPNFPGRWKYYTLCSDTANQGLQGQSGEFLCMATKGEGRFDLHGPVQVARDQQHLEHADRTPFFWLGDAAGLAALHSTTADWEEYLQTRARQKFSVVQWQLNSAAGKKAAFTGRDRIAINLDVFRQLDAKIIAANRAGLLSAIAPLWEIGLSAEEPLPEAQAILLLRYAVARWGAENVAWIIAFESDSTGAQAARWQKIGREVFSYVTHAPVILLPGESVWALDAFRRERWVDVLGLQTAAVADENSLPWFLNGPLAQERQKIPARPILSIAPPTEVITTPNAGEVTADFMRRLLWWSVLLNSPAGVSYSAKDLADWSPTPNAKADAQPWHQALTLPGATAIAPLADILGSRNFWQLEPDAKALFTQPGLQTALQYIAVASSEDHDLVMAFVPGSRAVNLSSKLTSARMKAVWFNPRNGESQPVTAPTITATTATFAPPAQGDWLLLLNRTKLAEVKSTRRESVKR